MRRLSLIFIASEELLSGVAQNADVIQCSGPSKEPQMDGSSGNGPGKRSWTRERTATLSLATWNVRTMLQARKMAEVAGEILKYGMDVG
jgi:hypothetical protein